MLSRRQELKISETHCIIKDNNKNYTNKKVLIRFKFDRIQNQKILFKKNSSHPFPIYFKGDTHVKTTIQKIGLFSYR